MLNEKIVSHRDIEQLLGNELYARYNVDKQKIIQKYPIQKLRTREENLAYIKELGDLIWDVNGAFQEFMFEQTPADVEFRREKKINPKKAGRTKVANR